MSEFRDQLTAALTGRVEFSADQASSLEAHYRSFERWNRRINLSSIRTLQDAVLRHYAECVYFAEILDQFAASAGFPVRGVADIGSGAGFPGIPIAIMRPAWRVTLIESHQRKAVFLREAARNLSNVEVVGGRAESVSESFDIAVSRAVNPSSVLNLTLSDRFGLLIGADDVPRGTGGRSVKLPWGEKRVAWLYDRQHTVPRGTLNRAL